MMKKQITKVIVLCALQCVGGMSATSFMQSPLYFDAYYVHYPLERDIECSRCEDSPWQFKLISGFYARTADKWFRSCEQSDDDSCKTAVSIPSFNKITTHTEPLSVGFFGKACFTGQEAFAGGELLQPCSPSLIAAILKPSIDYYEYGVVIGFDVFKEFGCDNRWRVGTRIQLPVKVIDVRQNRSGGVEIITPEACEDVHYSFADINPSGSFELFPAHAYRFDLLNTLETPAGQPLLKFLPADVTIYDELIDADVPNNASMNILKRADGTVDVKFDNIYGTPAEVTGGDLPADGSGPDDRYYLVQGRDYSAIQADLAVQQTLFLVPSGGALTTQIKEAMVIQNIVDQAIQQATCTGGDSVIDFFQDCCIDFFASSRTVGVGDLEIGFYGGYHADTWYTDLILDIKLPSGKKVHNARNIFRQPTGNNGHVQLGPIVEAGWNPCNYFALTVGAGYSHAIRARECKAAPFTGATVINIGPGVGAKVSWGAFKGHIDGTFFHPRNENLGVTFGYELYAKRKDDVDLCEKTAIDCCGDTNSLDARQLEVSSNTLTNKLRGTIFHRIRCWEFLAGASYIVSGRNAMQEAEWLLGINVYF